MLPFPRRRQSILFRYAFEANSLNCRYVPHTSREVYGDCVYQYKPRQAISTKRILPSHIKKRTHCVNCATTYLEEKNTMSDKNSDDAQPTGRTSRFRGRLQTHITILHPFSKTGIDVSPATHNHRTFSYSLSRWWCCSFVVVDILQHQLDCFVYTTKFKVY